MKKFIKVISILFLACALLVSGYAYCCYVTVSNVKIVNKKITSSKITPDLENLEIAFISDIHYNHFMDKYRLEKMVEKINQNQPDIILFGGDLFDDPQTYPVTEEKAKELASILKNLNADLGKFAVLGEEDHHESVEKLVNNLLFEADFELINNTSLLVTKNGNTSINLVGIDSLIKGTPDIPSALKDVDTKAFTIVLTHAPDLVKDLPTKGIDLVLSGHSHGGQVSLPLIGPLSEIKGATQYSRGEYEVGQMKVVVSNGLGTTGQDIRVMTDPQCHIFRLSNQ